MVVFSIWALGWSPSKGENKWQYWRWVTHCDIWFPWRHTTYTGPLEQTLLWTFTKGTNIQWWLRWEDCPEVLWQFKLFFNKAFSCESPEEKSSGKLTEIAHVRHNGVNLLCATTHLSNSLIFYYPSLTATLLIIGSIQNITTNRSGTQLAVKPQGPCPPNIYDPFIQYPWFPARILVLPRFSSAQLWLRSGSRTKNSAQLK